MTSYSARPLRCQKCSDVSDRIMDGFCPECWKVENRCVSCGVTSSTRPFKLRDADEIGLEASSRFCVKCAADHAGTHVEALA